MASDYNYIKNIAVQSCAVSNPIIIVETALEAAIPTMFSLIDYTCNDIMKMSGGHTWGPAKAAFSGIGIKKSRSGLRRMRKCGKKMFAEGAFPKAFNPQFVDGFKFVYEITETAFVENLLFKFFLFEVGKNFVINWMSLAYVAERCSLPPAGTIWTTWSALCSNAGGPIVCFIGPGTTECAHSGGHEIFVDSGCQATITWQGGWVPFRNDPANMANVTMWLEDDRGKIFGSTTPRLATGAMSLTQAGIVTNVPGAAATGTTYRLKARLEGPGLMCPDDSRPNTLTINTAGRPVNFMPMGGCARTLGRAHDQIWGFINDQFMVDQNGLSVNNRWYHPPAHETLNRAPRFGPQI